MNFTQVPNFQRVFARNYKQILALLIKATATCLVGFGSVSNAASFSPLILDDVAPSLRRSITNELQVFNEWLKGSPSNELLLDSELTASSLALSSWLSDRIKFITSNENEILKSKSILARDVKFPEVEFNRINPAKDVLSALDIDEIIVQAKPNDDVVVLMRNLGAQLYIGQKSEMQIWNLALEDDIAKTPLISPRIGLIEAGRALFSYERLVNQKDRESISNHLPRWMVLIHEARHSDGQGKFLAFQHSMCPKGHDYEGVMGCDHATKGSFAYGQRFLSQATKECADCSQAELEVLKLLVLDSANRILPDALSPSSIEQESEFVVLANKEDGAQTSVKELSASTEATLGLSP